MYYIYVNIYILYMCVYIYVLAVYCVAVYVHVCMYVCVLCKLRRICLLYLLQEINEDFYYILE